MWNTAPCPTGNTTCRRAHRLAVTTRASGPNVQPATDSKTKQLQPWQLRRLKRQQADGSLSELVQPGDTMGASLRPDPSSRPVRSVTQRVDHPAPEAFTPRDLPSSPTSPFYNAEALTIAIKSSDSYLQLSLLYASHKEVINHIHLGAFLTHVAALAVVSAPNQASADPFHSSRRIPHPPSPPAYPMPPLALTLTMELAQQALDCVEQLQPRQISNIMWVISKLQILPQQHLPAGWHETLVMAFIARLKEANGRDICSLLHALAAANSCSSSSISSTSGGRSNSGSDNSPAKSRQSQYNSQPLPDDQKQRSKEQPLPLIIPLQLLRDLLGQSTHLLASCNSQELSNALYALGSMQVRPSLKWRDAWLVASTAPDVMRQTTAQAHANILWSMSQLSLTLPSPAYKKWQYVMLNAVQALLQPQPTPSFTALLLTTSTNNLTEPLLINETSHSSGSSISNSHSSHSTDAQLGGKGNVSGAPPSPTESSASDEMFAPLSPPRPEHLTSILWGVARLEIVLPRSWLEDLLSWLYLRRTSLAAWPLTNILTVLAKIDYRPTDAWLEEVCMAVLLPHSIGPAAAASSNVPASATTPSSSTTSAATAASVPALKHSLVGRGTLIGSVQPSSSLGQSSGGVLLDKSLVRPVVEMADVVGLLCAFAGLRFQPPPRLLSYLLVQAGRESISSCSDQHLVDLVWAFSSASYCPEAALLTQIWNVTRTRLWSGSITGDQASKLLWAVTNLQLSPPPLWIEAMVVRVTAELPTLSDVKFMETVFGIGKLGVIPSDEFRNLVGASVAMRAPGMKGTTLCSLVAALPKLGFNRRLDNSEVLQPLLQAIGTLMKQHNTRTAAAAELAAGTASAVTSHASSAGGDASELSRDVVAAAADQMASSLSQHTTSTVRSSSSRDSSNSRSTLTLNGNPPSQTRRISAVAAAAAARLAEEQLIPPLSPVDVAKLMTGLVVIGYEPPIVWREYFVPMLEHRGFAEFSPWALVQVLDGLVWMKVTVTPLAQQRLLQSASSKFHEFTSKDFESMINSLHALKISPEECWWEALYRSTYPANAAKRGGEGVSALLGSGSGSAPQSTLFTPGKMSHLQSAAIAQAPDTSSSASLAATAAAVASGPGSSSAMGVPATSKQRGSRLNPADLVRLLYALAHPVSIPHPPAAWMEAVLAELQPSLPTLQPDVLARLMVALLRHWHVPGGTWMADVLATADTNSAMFHKTDHERLQKAWLGLNRLRKQHRHDTEVADRRLARRERFAGLKHDRSLVSKSAQEEAGISDSSTAPVTTAISTTSISDSDSSDNLNSSGSSTAASTSTFAISANIASTIDIGSPKLSSKSSSRSRSALVSGYSSSSRGDTTASRVGSMPEQEITVPDKVTGGSGVRGKHAARERAMALVLARKVANADVATTVCEPTSTHFPGSPDHTPPCSAVSDGGQVEADVAGGGNSSSSSPTPSSIVTISTSPVSSHTSSDSSNSSSHSSSSSGSSSGSTTGQATLSPQKVVTKVKTKPNRNLKPTHPEEADVPQVDVDQGAVVQTVDAPSSKASPNSRDCSLAGTAEGDGGQVEEDVERSGSSLTLSSNMGTSPTSVSSHNSSSGSSSSGGSSNGSSGGSSGGGSSSHPSSSVTGTTVRPVLIFPLKVTVNVTPKATARVKAKVESSAGKKQKPAHQGATEYTQAVTETQGAVGDSTSPLTSSPPCDPPAPAAAVAFEPQVARDAEERNSKPKTFEPSRMGTSNKYGKSFRIWNRSEREDAGRTYSRSVGSVDEAPLAQGATRQQAV